MARADLVLDGIRKVAVALARRLVQIDKAEADRIEEVMQAVIDPIYERASHADPMMRVLLFCEDIRAVTGLPVLPKSPAP